MPFDAAPSRPAVTPVATASPRKKRADLTLGVFSHDGDWKIYSAQDTPIPYDTRDGAVAAAEEQALQAVRAGRRVELFVQEEDGTLRQATLELH